MLKLPYQMCLLMETFAKEFVDEEGKLNSPFYACISIGMEIPVL